MEKKDDHNPSIKRNLDPFGIFHSSQNFIECFFKKKATKLKTFEIKLKRNESFLSLNYPIYETNGIAEIG